MKPKDLRDGMVVRLKSGDKCLVFNGEFYDSEFLKSVNCRTCNYDDNMNSVISSRFDIQEVYDTPSAMCHVHLSNMLWERPIDWSKIEIDTKILVRDNDSEEWFRRHFAGVKDGIVYAWGDGGTSWSIGKGKRTVCWKQAKLYKEEKKDGE